MGARFDPNIISLFEAWTTPGKGGSKAARESIARGERIFNNHDVHHRGSSRPQ